MRPLRFAFIGCGNIALFHADVVKHLGHSIDIVVARKDSVNIDKFAKMYKVKQKLYGVDSFLKYCAGAGDTVDCILVCTSWDITEQVLEKLLVLDIPIMTEKPAVISVNSFNKLKKRHNRKNLFVAYNRRRYDYMPLLKELLEHESLLCIDVLCAEPVIEEALRYTDDKMRRYIVYERVSHMIDALFYLFGDIEIKNISEIASYNWVCELIVKEKVPLYMKILKDCPQNLYLKIFFDRKVAEVSPYEKMTIYDKLVKQEIDKKRMYFPSIYRQVETDSTFKPGFLNQMRYFIENFVEKKNTSIKYIDQLEKLASFCEQIVKS